ncbi:hypothetical protein U3516DRAFT_915194 [Neocallimastix sp. 'constans']
MSNSNIRKDSRLYNHRVSLLSNTSLRRKSKVLNKDVSMTSTRIPHGACSLSTQETPSPTHKKSANFSKYYFKNRIHLISNEKGMYYVKDEEYNLKGR